MREIKYIVLHCTAGPQDQPTAEILAFWRNHNGWKNPGYHFEINKDGTIEELWPIEKIANGVAGHNSHSIHISYKGGIDKKGKPIDNRTDEQKKSQIALVNKFKQMFPNAVVLGHRDFSTDLNGNGIIDRWEWIKSCPAFDVRDWLAAKSLGSVTIPSGIVYKLNYPLIKNDTVKGIQLALGIKVDGFFGKDTDTAVREFQQRKGLKADGVVGKDTAKAMGVAL